MAKALLMTGHALRSIGRWAWRLLIAAILGLALGLLGLRWAAPLLVDWRSATQQLLADVLQRPVSMHNLELSWWGWNPELHVQDLVILNKNQQEQLFSFQQAYARINLSRSLWQARLIVSDVRLEGGEAMLDAATWSAEVIDLSDALHWLQNLERVSIKLDRIWLRSAHAKDRSDKLELGRDFSLLLESSDGPSRQLKAVLPLNSVFGRQISLAADIAEGAGHFYVQGENIQLAALPITEQTPQGSGTVELWGDWNQQQLVAAQLKADLRGLRWTESGATLPAARLSAQGYRQNAFWTWQLMAEQGDMPAKPLYAELEQRPDQHWRLRLDDVDVSSIQPWLSGLSSSYARWLERLQPTGVLRQLELAWDGKRNQPTLSATIQNFHSQAWERIPGIQGLEAQIQFAGNQGRLELNGSDMQLDWPILRETVQGVQLQGPIRWQWEQSTWTVDAIDLKISNQDLKARFNGGLSFTPRGMWLDMQLSYERIDIARIPSYLPAAIMKPKLVAWLDHALKSGEVSQGTMILRGWTEDFPFDQSGNPNEGLFETQFQVANMRLDYFPGWTGIQDLSAQVTFRNRGFTVEADGGFLGGAAVQKVNARIDDLAHAELHIHSELSGATADMLEVVAQSPLREKIWTRLMGLRPSGQNKLTLGLRIPIGATDDPVQVDGIVEFTGGKVHIPEHDLRFDNVRGQLSFDESSVSAERLSLRFLNSPATLAITPGKNQLDFRLRGHFDSAAMVRPYSDALSVSVQGESDWEIGLEVPEDVKRPLRLAISSTLHGTQVLLPEPLGKQAEQNRSLRLDLAQNRDRWGLQFQLEPDISAAFELTPTDEGWTAQRGELRFNSGTAKLPQHAERVLIAYLPSYELKSLGGGAGLTLFDRSEILVNHLHIGQWRITDTRMQGSKTRDGYQWTVDGRNSRGHIFLPHQISPAEPVYIALDALRLRRTRTLPLETTDIDAQSFIDPRQLPPLHLDIERFFLDEWLLGRITTVLEPITEGLALRIFEINSAQHQLSATGEWIWRGQQHSSEVQVKFYSDALGEVLAQWNIPLQLERAKTALSLDLNWPGTLASPAWTGLNGILKVHVEEGLLRGVKPGLGRMVGLFNIASLARRLTFDFSDLLEDGLAFDQINGTIHLASGKASTKDLLLQGPAVNIALQGSLDLNDQQMQQTVIIRPQIASSLALAGAVAGGPAVGAAVLLAGQVLKPGLEQAVSVQYEVSGSLADPLVQQIGVTSEASEPQRGGGRK